jgi:ketosteroid isomerase-like protein
MSEANVDLVRRGFESLREGDFETLLPLIHPEFEATTPAALAAEPDTYRGQDGVRRYFESFYDAMDRVRFEADEFIEVGELVVVPMTLLARGRTTGIETAQRIVLVWEVKDGLAYRANVYATLEEAMEAAHSQH